jgi:outer membrane protein assembly factor BamB
VSRNLRIAALIVAVLALSGCSAFGKKDEELKPVELLDIETTLDVRKLWSLKLGDDAEFLRVMLRPAGDGNRVYAASRDGNVVAVNAESGKKTWEVQLEITLSAGPSVGNGMVVVGSADGLVIVLNVEDGTERWRVDLGGEVLSPALIANDLVIVSTIDNRLRALRGFDGSEAWDLEKQTPALTMRGSAIPAAAGNSVVAGFDSGRLLAADMESGNVLWESLLAPPSGRSDLERLSDIDGQISVVGQDIYAAGYQGKVASVAAESGQLLWAREISTYVGVAADWTSVYTTNETGEVICLARRNGQENWRQDSLLRREPTLPTPFDTAVVVGDLEGYLHFFNKFDGEPVARLRQGSAAISAPPTAIGDRLYVQSDSGTIAAYSVRKPETPPQAPAAAEDEGA